MNTFTFTAFKGTSFEKTYENCYFKPGRYGNGNLALSIASDEDGAITTCTVNPGEEISPIAICIKNYSENIGMDKFLIDLGIVYPDPNCYKPCGWVSVPVHILTAKGREIFNGKED